jgi:cation diffusion facilitator CzcD-associated flavoprotein CzcO
MKTFKYLLILFLSLGLFASCSDDDDPDPVNEEEVITTVTLTLSPQGGGTSVVFQSRDADGDGPDAPVITVTGDLMANTQYSGTVEFLNELETPAEDITTEVLEEGDEHQVFYSFTGTAGSTIIYEDIDQDSNPIGVSISLNSGAAADNNTMTLVLRHEPTKPNNGTAADAGGETDVEATFSYNVN